MNNDVVTEILLHLSVQSLLRFRVVSKFWKKVIDSRPFRKLYTQNDDNNNNKLGDTVDLQLSLSNGQLQIQHNHKSLISEESDHFKGLADDQVMLHGPVKGLICIECTNIKVHIAICNPFLGQLKHLPLISNSKCTIIYRRAGIGFDEDYKVVQVLSCMTHIRFHAYVYSGTTNSWREFRENDGVLDYVRLINDCAIKLDRKNDHFAHWSKTFEYRGSFVSLKEN
ncbi:putative F-box protein [Salvia divinorum]|uniref:F-box protein n=1 Tax=Salvia divinorum TaxID=28513 RepID=A0ABD1IH85_SALDI